MSFDPIPNTLYKGDCIEIMKKMPDESIDLIITDPPYLINYKSRRKKNKDHVFCKGLANSNNSELISDYIKECYRIMKSNTAMYMFCNMDKIEFFKTEIEKYFKVKNIIIWVKNNHTAGDLEAQFGKKYEIIILANKGRAFFRGKRLTDVWEFSKVYGKEQLHQNQKPVDLLEQCILKHSDEGQLVFDGFAGAGSTGIACKNTGRNYIMIELDENYYQIAFDRLNSIRSSKT